MKSLISNFCSLSILATSLATFNVPAALASDLKAISSKEIQLSQQDEIRNIFAQYSTTIESAGGQRRALAEAALAMRAKNVSNEDLLKFAEADMNPVEAASFRAKVARYTSANLSEEESSELLQEIVASTSKGSNFLGCGVGSFISIFTGTGFFVVGILALTKLGDATKTQRREIQLEKVDAQSTINILISEGVSPNSYLVTSMKADIAFMDEQLAQLEEKRQDDKKSAQTLGMIAGGLGAASILLLMDDNCY